MMQFIFIEKIKTLDEDKDKQLDVGEREEERTGVKSILEKIK
jgi:hypothetical protein